MNWNNFVTYGDSQQNAFETLCNQLFERYLRRKYSQNLIKFRVINGTGGDGGIEAYGELRTGEIIAVQAKCFTTKSLEDGQIKQIKNSIITAKKVRPEIKKYIICVPHDINSKKIGKGNKPTTNHEEKKLNTLVDEIDKDYTDLELIWWFDNEILTELQETNNEGIHKFWFEREIISFSHLQKQFNLQKKGWLYERYVPELHAQGVIHKECEKICFSFEYRQELNSELTQIKRDLQFAISLIDEYLATNPQNADLTTGLEVINTNLFAFCSEIDNISKAVREGNECYKPHIIDEISLWDTILTLEKIAPNNIQKNILRKLPRILEKIHRYHLSQYIEHVSLAFSQHIRLILGGAGTGKTHGLSHCEATHLQQNSPAIIIRAKGSPCDSWTNMLSQALELPTWRKEEVFSALETLAIRNEVTEGKQLEVGAELAKEATKVLICIDGLEEDLANKKQWYERMRECEEFCKNYPRLRFIFSARNEFYDNTQVPNYGGFESVSLPTKGDVSIQDVAPLYFSKAHYNIQLSSYSLIKGIDSLLALRLFCEKYKGQNIHENSNIKTKERELLIEKMNRLNQEFLERLEPDAYPNNFYPVREGLSMIADFFYQYAEISERQLIEKFSKEFSNYLDRKEINRLIKHLVKNGILIRFEKSDDSDFPPQVTPFYSISYQSIIEHIISEKIYSKIKKGELTHIPRTLYEKNTTEIYSQKIFQNIVNNLFIETENLIGVNDFLAEGFTDEEMFDMQLKALIKAPAKLAKKYKNGIDALFYENYESRYLILNDLIIPSSYSNENFFGAEYLHEILINQASTFERDKLWSSYDDYEKTIQITNNFERAFYENKTLSVIFPELRIDTLFLHESLKHNELPLICAWGLSNIDQKLRNRLRVALTSWAIKSPSEFALLLDKIFDCNDPQIQEDLASIMLGVASRLKDKKGIMSLALWAIQHVFSQREKHRNIVVRQGFRAIVERAYQFELISQEEVEKCRPQKINNLSLLGLDESYLKAKTEAFYPITSDLNWYVIKEAYKDFLAYPDDEFISKDTPEAEQLLAIYRKKYKDERLFNHRWTMAVAIHYIKDELGFTRSEGNEWTKETHGSKSEIFTYEEKYTWLAVHYIQGYLADYVPFKISNWQDEYHEFVEDYSLLVDIPNPAELITQETAKSKPNSEWIIKEVLSKELDSNIELKESITNWVHEEPHLNWEKWLCFDSSNFQIDGENRKWMALYNFTRLYDSKELVYSSLDAKACLIDRKYLPKLQQRIKNKPIDGFCASPDTSSYCNPSDIVWMTWIEEVENKMPLFYDENDETKYLHTSLVQITQKIISEEKFIMLPSKKVRTLIGTYELLGNELKDADSITRAFNYSISTGFYKDSQELVLVDEALLKDAIQKEGLEMVWLVQVFKQKNPLNKTLDKDFHVQKSRKYFVWIEKGELKFLKFWDYRYSN